MSAIWPAPVPRTAEPVGGPRPFSDTRCHGLVAAKQPLALGDTDRFGPFERREGCRWAGPVSTTGLGTMRRRRSSVPFGRS